MKGKGTKPSRKVKRTRKTAAERELEAIVSKAADIGVPVAQIINGQFVLVDVPRIDKGVKVTTTHTLRNRSTAILVEWFAQGGPGFEHPQEQAIEYIEGLWRKATTQGRIVANYGFVSRGGVEGVNHFEAIAELGEWKKLFGEVYWNAFENVVRHGEPAGVAGSRFAVNRPQASASAKAIVGLVASVIATKKHF